MTGDRALPGFFFFLNPCMLLVSRKKDRFLTAGCYKLLISNALFEREKKSPNKLRLNREFHRMVEWEDILEVFSFVFALCKFQELVCALQTSFEILKAFQLFFTTVLRSKQRALETILPDNPYPGFIISCPGTLSYRRAWSYQKKMLKGYSTLKKIPNI